MMAQAGAVNGQGSCTRGEGSLTAQSGQRHWRLRLSQARQWRLGYCTDRDWDAGTLFTAAMEAEQLKERRRR